MDSKTELVVTRWKIPEERWTSGAENIPQNPQHPVPEAPEAPCESEPKSGEKCSAQLKAPGAKPRLPCGSCREVGSSGGGTHVNDGLLRLSHVRYDAVGDDEQDKVLGAVLHRCRVPADRERHRHRHRLGAGHMAQDSPPQPPLFTQRVIHRCLQKRNMLCVLQVSQVSLTGVVRGSE